MSSTRGTRHDEKIEELRSISSLSCSLPEDLGTIAAAGDIVDLPGGSVLKAEGQRVHWTHIVLRGYVILSCNGSILGHAGPGTVVGGAEVTSSSPSPDSVMTVTGIRAMVIGQRELEALLDRCPSLRCALVRSVPGRLAAPAPPGQPLPDSASV